MKSDEKYHGKLKCKVEDFIVEEIGDKWDCVVSEKFESGLVDLGKLDLEDPLAARGIHSQLGTSGEVPSSSRNFLWCEMEKFDLDHFSAIKEVASGLGCGIDSIGYGGSKDKKAWTSQRISIFKPNMERVKSFRHPNIVLKNLRWAKRKIKMGYLEGNRFRIVVRDIDKKGAIKVANRVRGMNWFPNYFGSQRFGSIRGNNVKIGKLILKRKFEEAVWAILADVGENERPDLRFAREKLAREKDLLAAAKYFPHYLRLEKEILYYLSRKPGDFLGAIKRAERKNMLMFVNAVQSKIFNDVLERALDEGLDFTKKGQQSCLLMGYKTRFYDGRLGDIEQDVLAEHGLELNDFDVREIPYLRIKGSFRKAVVEVRDLEVDVSDDEDFEGSKKISLSFVLPSGVYATTFLGMFFDF